MQFLWKQILCCRGCILLLATEATLSLQLEDSMRMLQWQYFEAITTSPFSNVDKQIGHSNCLSWFVLVASSVPVVVGN